METKHFFQYSDAEIEYLKAKDPVLGKAMDEIGRVQREVIPDLFAALLNSITGQQISSKAHASVWRRFCETASPVSPQRVAALPLETIQGCGMTMKKAEYIKEIAQSIVDGSLDLDELYALPDDEVCKRLSQIRGVGVWTAEMLMIFSMGRMDVISMGDMAILRGMRILYRHRKITPQLFAKYKRRYSPYATVASLYLWEISHGIYGLGDPAPKAVKKTAK